MPTAREIVRENVAGSILFLISVIGFAALLLARSSFQTNIYGVILILLILVPGGLAVATMLSLALRVPKCEDELIITEEGIQLHWRTISMARRGEHNFIPFESVAMVFPNLNRNLPYITLLLEDGDAIETDKSYVEDLLGFVSRLSQKTRVEVSRDRILNVKERWFVRCRSKE